MSVKSICMLAAVVAAPVPALLAAQQWTPATCDLKPGHFKVNSGVLYLKSASETRFEDKRQKDLKDASKVLLEAITANGQEKNPAAWYYLGRYYALTNDLQGADTAFTKASTLAPQCQKDIAAWRRLFWVPVFNEGIKAWQAGSTDSAIASFRRANAIYDGEPTAFMYLGSLFANGNQPDSAAKYFKLAVPAARDSQYAKDKRDALFNVARVYHAAQRWDAAAAAYQDYLAAYPNDVQAMAGLAAIYSEQKKGKEADALFAQILDHADSAEPADLFAAGQGIINAVPTEPDTAPAGNKCRADTRAKSRTLTVRQVALKCKAVTDSVMKDYEASLLPRYRVAARAYEAGLAKNPYDREGLYKLSGLTQLLGDTAKVLPLAQRLYAVDPLSRPALARLAGAWQLKGNKDSALYYLTLADSLSLEVTVGSFSPDEHGAKIGGLFTNLKAKPSAPAGITFEFLDAKGTVVATDRQDVTPVDPSGNRPFDIKASGAGIVAWRYRKS
jgi:tetratricopeptide (TPR) repeat protein